MTVSLYTSACMKITVIFCLPHILSDQRTLVVLQMLQTIE